MIDTFGFIVSTNICKLPFMRRVLLLIVSGFHPEIFRASIHVVTASGGLTVLTLIFSHAAGSILASSTHVVESPRKLRRALISSLVASSLVASPINPESFF